MSKEDVKALEAAQKALLALSERLRREIEAGATLFNIRAVLKEAKGPGHQGVGHA